MSTTIRVGALVVLLGTLMTAHAADDRGAYVGAGVGETLNNSQTAYKIFGGYGFNRYFAIEAQYFDSSGNQNFILGSGSYSTSNSGFIVSAVGILPIGDSFELFSKLGAAFFDAKVSAFGAKKSYSEAAYAVGGSYVIARQFALSLELEAPNFSGDFNRFMLSGAYRFGR